MKAFITLLMNPSILVAMVVIAIVAGGAGFLKGAGYEKAVLQRKALEAQIAETARQDKANEDAKKVAGAVIDSLNDEITRLNAQLQENANEAQKDPAADNCGISPLSVQRLNRIR